MKAFNIVLADLNNGITHTALTADFHELVQTVQSTGRAGSMTLKLKVAPASKGGYVDNVTIVADRKLELPKPEARSDFFFVGDDAVITRQHPKQHDLDLRDAQDTRGGLRDPITPTAAFIQTDADGVITNLKDVSK